VQFIDIEALSFPLPSRDELAAYVVYVGFDDSATKMRRKRQECKKSGRRSSSSCMAETATHLVCQEYAKDILIPAAGARNAGLRGGIVRL